MTRVWCEIHVGHDHFLLDTAVLVEIANNRVQSNSNRPQLTPIEHRSNNRAQSNSNHTQSTPIKVRSGAIVQIELIKGSDRRERERGSLRLSSLSKSNRRERGSVGEKVSERERERERERLSRKLVN